ncbi:hypothetical protein D3C71_1821300 [compost metagenome]
MLLPGLLAGTALALVTVPGWGRVACSKAVRPDSEASTGAAALARPRSFQFGLSPQLPSWKLSAAEDARPSQNRRRLEVFFLEAGEALLRLLAVRVLFVICGDVNPQTSCSRAKA